MGGGCLVMGLGAKVTGLAPRHLSPTTQPLFQIVSQLLGAAGVAQLAERLRLDLADALAGDPELPPDLLQRALAAVVQAEAELEHATLTAGERVQHVLDLLL